MTDEGNDVRWFWRVDARTLWRLAGTPPPPVPLVTLLRLAPRSCWATAAEGEEEEHEGEITALLLLANTLTMETLVVIIAPKTTQIIRTTTP